MFFSADLSLAAGKMRKNYLVTGGFRYNFKETQALSVRIFSVKIFEAGTRVIGRISKFVSNFKRAR
jgi:hypothetical protein